MFNKQELFHWLITRFTQLPIEKTIETLDKQKSLALLDNEELQQVQRIFKLFGRFDLMLVMISITNLPYDNEITRQMRFKDLHELYKLLGNTRHLSWIAKYDCWPAFENDLQNPVKPSVFSDKFVANLEKKLTGKRTPGDEIEFAMMDYLVPKQCQHDFLSDTKNITRVQKFRDIKFLYTVPRQALLKNPLFTHEKETALSLTLKADKDNALSVMQNSFIDYQVDTEKNFAEAYREGWNPGRLFAHHLQFYVENARAILRALPRQAQADLILFTNLTYGIATPHLLGLIVRDNRIIRLLTPAQQKDLNISIAWSEVEGTTQEIPPYVLATILQYSNDEVRRQLSNEIASNCYHMRNVMPRLKYLAADLAYIKNALNKEYETLLQLIVNPQWEKKFSFYKKLQFYSYYSFTLTSMWFMFGMLTFFYISPLKPFNENQEIYTNRMLALIANGLLSIVISFSPAMAGLFGFLWGGEHQRKQTRVNFLELNTLTTEPVQKVQTRLNQTAKIIQGIIYVCSQMDYYKHSFLLFEQLQTQLENIKKVCEAISLYQANLPTGRLQTLLKNAPFSVHEVSLPFTPKEKLQKIESFIDDLPDLALRKIRESHGFFKKIEDYREGHPLNELQPDDPDAMYRIV